MDDENASTEETLSAGPHDHPEDAGPAAPPEPAAPMAALEAALSPERAFRRVRRGLGLTAMAFVAMGASSAAGLAVYVVATGVEAPPPSSPPRTAAATDAAATLPAALDVDGVRAQVGELAAELDALRGRELERAGEVQLGRLVTDVDKLMKEIRVARDARLKAGERKTLGGPFTAEELKGSFPGLGLSQGRGRLLLDRRGNVLAPEGGAASVPPEVDLVAPGSDRVAKTETVTQGTTRIVVGLACLPREKHCLAEVARFEVTPTDVSALTAALDDVRAADAAWRTLFTEQQAPEAAEMRTGHGPERPWALAALALLVAMLVGGGLLLVWRTRVTEASAALARRAEALASGRAGEGPSRAPAELMAAHEALDLLAERLTGLERQAAHDRERRERARAWARSIDEMTRGRLDLRIPPGGDAPEQNLAESLNLLVETLERRVLRLQSHLDVLDAQGGAPPRPTAGDDVGSPKENLEKRLDSLRPVGALLADIGVRTRSLARTAPEGSSLHNDLLRLGDAVTSRAKTCQALLDGMATDVGALEEKLPSASGLSEAKARALSALAADLRGFGAVPTLPALLDAVRDLGEAEAEQRWLLRRAAPTPPPAEA